MSPISHSTFIRICREFNVSEFMDSDDLVSVLKTYLDKHEKEMMEAMNKANSISYAIQYLENKSKDTKVEKNTSVLRSSIYIIEGENGRYKIGVSKNPNTRLKDLKRASCEDHYLLFHKEVTEAYKLESKLHNEFKDKRNHSEWFSLSGDDIEDILNMIEEWGI